MGKASRKFNKKKQKETTLNQQSAGSQLRKQMAELEEKMEYARAIETLAELVDKNLVIAADMYAGARDYFMLGDYTRSGQCVNTVLSMEPNHIGARILLGKLCLNEERVDDALAIYDFVLRNFCERLTQEQEKEILESLRYYGRHEPERLQAEYPACHRFLDQKMGNQPVSQDTLSQTAAAIARMKEHIVVPRQAAPSGDTAAQEKKEIQERQCSLMEQVSLLNRFAGAHFYESDYAGARELLVAALEIDPGSDMSLRNLSLLLSAAGDKEKALEVASRMQATDFVLLQQLK